MENKKYSIINVNRSNKNIQKGKIKQRYLNMSNDKNKNINNYNEISHKNFSGKNFNKFLESYHKFVKINFGNYDFKQKIILTKREQEVLSKKMKEREISVKANIKINVKEVKNEFYNFLNKTPPYTFEDNIICEIPDTPEFYCEENQLGQNKNNKEDYLFRKKKDIETININLNLSYDEPLEELDDEDDTNNENNKLELNIDENELPNPSIINDQEIRDRLEYIINHCGDKLDTITNFWKKKRKKIKLFIGFDKKSDNIFYMIYGKGFDKNGKIKNIELKRFWKWRDEWIELISENSINKIFDVDSMSKDQLLNRIDDIINAFSE